MKRQVKAIVPSVLVVAAMGAFALPSAPAETGGHFVSSVSHTTLVGSETSLHQVEFTAGSGVINCTKGSYHGTIATETVTELTLKPAWSECFTTGSTQKFEIHENGCHYLFTIGRSTHHTMHIVCPPTKLIDITHTNCTIQIPPQTVSGIVYNTLTENNRHTLTVAATASTEARYEGGICVFLGTAQTLQMGGGMTLSGQNTISEQVHITATG